MRTVTISPDLLADLFAHADGPFVEIPVTLPWPELPPRLQTFMLLIPVPVKSTGTGTGN